MSFRAGVLELHLIAPSVEALDGIKQAMSRDGAHGRTAVGEPSATSWSRAACKSRLGAA